jgi:uncharacterized protein (TIGR03083 family)
MASAHKPNAGNSNAGNSKDIWPTVHAERQALADDLAGLTPEQWATASLSEGWTVHDALAHLLVLAQMTPFRFVTRFAGSGFNFDRYAERGIAGARRPDPKQTLAAFRDASGRTSAPLGPPQTWVGEHIVHGEDIRRPLGLTRSYPMDAVLATLDFYHGSQPIIGGRDRVAGLTLKATDADHSIGSGPEVTGPALDLVLAATGRPAGWPNLTGPGLDTLKARADGG